MAFIKFLSRVFILIIASLGYSRSLVVYIIVLCLRIRLLGSLLFLLQSRSLYFEKLLWYDLVFALIVHIRRILLCYF